MTAGDLAQDQTAFCVAEVNNNSSKISAKTADSTTDVPVTGSTKYSLRARSARKRPEPDYQLDEPKVRGQRQKARPPPLSKYRRKTANARERDRMKDINQAFDVLERSLPEISAQQRQAEKVTKITVLRLAINYIKAMQDLLDSESDGLMSVSETSGSPHSVSSATSSTVSSSSGSPSSVLTDCSMTDLPDPLDNIEGLTDFQLPGGLELLLDIRNDSDGLDFSCSDFSDLPSPQSGQ